jgi:RNA polymerase sporulation-specific sigma factor
MNKPQRQENERLLQCVERFKLDGNQEAFDEIVQALHGYLQYMSLRKFFKIPGSNSDDVYQEGCIALATKAIPDYDGAKGSFLTFAKLCIRRHIITILKSANGTRHGPLNLAMSMDSTMCDDEDDGPVPASNFLPNGKENVVDTMVRNEGHARLKNLLASRLTPLESVVLGFYLKNMSYTDIVVLMNKTRRGKNRVVPKTIDNALCRIKKKAMELDEATLKDDGRQSPLFDDEDEQ